MRKNLKKWMIDHDFRQNDVAYAIDVSVPNFSMIVTGKRNATLKILETFNEVYEIGSMDKTIEIFKDE